MKVLLTGGAGYIGSHTALEILEAGHEVEVMDNMYNASEEALNRVMKLTGKSITLHKIDLLDAEGMNKLFGALAAVGSHSHDLCGALHSPCPCLHYVMMGMHEGSHLSA